MYSRVSTSGIIIAFTNKSEADRGYWIFTEKKGLLYVQAKGVRKETSKLRFHMQPGNFIEIEILESKTGWRLVGAFPVSGCVSNEKTFEVIMRLGILVRRLMLINEPDKKVWNILKNIFTDSLILDSDQTAGNDLLVKKQAELLFALGYAEKELLYSGERERRTRVREILERIDF